MSNKAEHEPEVVVVEPKRTRKRWSVGSIFWGLLLILIGTIFLLDNLNVIEVNFANVWQLWPVLIIGAGLSLLTFKGWVGALVSTIAAVVLLALIAFVVIVNPWYPGASNATTQTATESVAVVDSKKLDVTIDTGAVTIDLGSNQNEKGATLIQKSKALGLSKSSTVRDGVQYVTFESTMLAGSWFKSPADNTIDATFGQKTPTALTIKMGAATVRGDLSQVRLTALDINTGASSIDLRLGAIEAQQDIKIDAGVSSIVLYVPREVGLRINTDKGLSSTQFEGVSKVSDSVYESDGFAAAEKKITVRASMGVSNFEVKRY